MKGRPVERERRKSEGVQASQDKEGGREDYSRGKETCDSFRGIVPYGKGRREAGNQVGREKGG